MTGPEHYKEAEKLAAAAVSKPPASAAPTTLLALTHATLALAAATAAAGMGSAVTVTRALADWARLLNGGDAG